MSKEQHRQREKLVLGMLSFTHGTPLEADLCEQQLLAAYVQGGLTLAQVEHLLKFRALLATKL